MKIIEEKLPLNTQKHKTGPCSEEAEEKYDMIRYDRKERETETERERETVRERDSERDKCFIN